MTPIKSLAMIKRSLEKAFMCKSHFMIMIHSEWCPLLFTCLLWDKPAIYFGVRKCGLGGGGGLAKTEKQNHAQEKKGKKLVHKEAWENLYASLTCIWDLYNGNVRKEMLIFFRIPFE